jgi:crotonobetaine/carnitine-CoA ligase
MIPYIADRSGKSSLEVDLDVAALGADGRRTVGARIARKEPPHLVTDSLWRSVSARATEHPGAPLIIEADGETYSNSYAVDLIGLWANALTVARSGRLATLLPNQAAVPLLRLAAGRARAPFAAVNPILRGPMLADALRRMSATDVVVSGETEMLIGEIAHLLPSGLRVHHIAGDELIVDGVATGEPDLDQDPDPTTVPTLVYTSGTSGPAKPVLLRASSLSLYGHNLVNDTGKAWPPGTGYYSPWHPAHILGAVALDAAVQRDLILVIRQKFTADTFWTDVTTFSCGMAVLVSVGDELWARRQPGQRDNPVELLGMAPLIREYAAFEQYFGVEVVSMYGMTELGNVLVGRSPRDFRSVGRPVDGYQIRLDPVEHPADVPGTAGEMLVRPAISTSVYDTAEGMVSENWRDGWFHTGDLFVADEDGYRFVGRLKDCIRRRGRNISATDLEVQIREIAGIEDCACIGVSPPGSPAGDDADIRVFIQPDPGVTFDLEAVIAQLRDVLPRYMLPRYFDVVDELPRTPNGKLLRETLRQRAITERTRDCGALASAG